ncbi:MAG: hypothetical protein B7Y36_03940 [Novosphingobium sp. 28-62-57]|uniref:hypothetical protein n=1 Tax=unclassified Novosphingobium TaxID=2644732 RepID=UPI000BDC9B8C|nr:MULTISPECIES: hypothetical protein [unclassified Novosphingobium]OYW48923.1 MAG: hypothetical protein B7Z34_11080 [Novosphingobium sp. 12-62-10]OYZ12652.1 MAG: hypothetical protein B7Y36_03940 [Novosphingobium sp. 28-62-57]OZA39679.1 MAG: hypothetical protein B7X92_02495 [Novosphingobium sp. 17-62-9]
MFIGHYAPAFIAAASRKAPSLAVLIVAVQVLDYAFFSFALLGIEHYRLTPNFTASNWLDLYDMRYSHSLLGAAVFGALFGGLVLAFTRSRAAAGIAFACVLSHWLADWIVHAPDLTLAGSPPKLGLGLWNHPLAEHTLEVLLAFGSLAYYAACTRAAGPRAGLMLGLFAGVLALFQVLDWFSPRTTQVSAAQPLLALFAFTVLSALAMLVQATRSKVSEPRRVA